MGAPRGTGIALAAIVGAGVAGSVLAARCAVAVPCMLAALAVVGAVCWELGRDGGDRPDTERSTAAPTRGFRLRVDLSCAGVLVLASVGAAQAVALALALHGAPAAATGLGVASALVLLVLGLLPGGAR